MAARSRDRPLYSIVVEKPLPLQYGSQTALLFDGAHNYRNPIVPGKRDCGPVHDAEVLAQDIVIAQALVAARFWVLFRVGIVDAIDLGRLQHGVAAHLGGAQRRGGVGGEKRIAGAADEHDHLALLQMRESARARMKGSQMVGMGMADITRTGSP